MVFLTMKNTLQATKMEDPIFSARDRSFSLSTEVYMLLSTCEVRSFKYFKFSSVPDAARDYHICSNLSTSF